jgi:hypothetical protein
MPARPVAEELNENGLTRIKPFISLNENQPLLILKLDHFKSESYSNNITSSSTVLPTGKQPGTLVDHQDFCAVIAGRIVYSSAHGLK